MEVSRPCTAALLAHLSKGRTELKTVHVLPDANSMELHIQGVSNTAKKRQGGVAYVN